MNMQTMKKYELKKWNYEKVWIATMNWTMKWLWNDYEMTMKWLWNDYEMTMNWLWIDYELTMNYDMKCTMKKYMKWWYALTMHWLLIVWFKYEFMYEKVFFNKLIIWKCMNHLKIVSYEVCIYLGLNDTGRARRDSYEALSSHAAGKDETSSRATDRLGVDSRIMPPDLRRLACFRDSGKVS